MNQEALKILLVEDNPSDAHLIESLLSEFVRLDIHLDWVENLADGLKRLEQQPFDAVLLDLSLPDSQGLDTIARLHAVVPSLPIIVYTGLEDAIIAMQAVQAGAHDYLVKGQVSSESLARTIHYAVERMAAEATLKRSEAQYRSLTENHPDLIARFDRQLRHVYVNPAAAAAGALSQEEYIGLTIAESGVPADQARKWEAHLRSIFETGQIVEVEDTFETPVGSSCFQTKFVPEFAPDGSIQTVLSVARDITERKRAEDALWESEAALSEAQAIAQLGSWEYDVATDKAKWSKEMFRIFGREPSLGEPSWLGHRASIHPDDWASVNAAVQTAIQQGKPYALEFRVIHPDASIVWGWTIGKAIRDNTDKVVKLFGTAQDITERKRTEEKIKEQMEELQRWYDLMLDREDRTLELKQEVNELLRRLGEPPRYPSTQD